MAARKGPVGVVGLRIDGAGDYSRPSVRLIRRTRDYLARPPSTHAAITHPEWVVELQACPGPTN